MSIRDLPGSPRVPFRMILAAAALGLAGCGPPPNADVITATLCFTPESAASGIRVELHRRLERGGYGDTSAAKFGTRYVDLADPLLRPQVTCCGEQPAFGQCRDGATPVDLFVDVRRALTPEEREQLHRQLETELDAAYEAVRR